MTTFKPDFVSMRSLKFASILSTCTTTGHSRGQLLRVFGQCLNRCSPPDEQKLQVLSNTWRVITTLTDSTEYLLCVEMWAQFISEHFGVSIRVSLVVNNSFDKRCTFSRVKLTHFSVTFCPNSRQPELLKITYPS
jgi:hypothetical protein